MPSNEADGKLPAGSDAIERGEGLRASAQCEGQSGAL